MASEKKLRVGILGFGALGMHIYDAITTDPSVSSRLEIAYVWNRSPAALDRIPSTLRLESLDDVPNAAPAADIVIEVSHPSISASLAERVLRAGGNFVVGSPTCFADPAVEAALRAAAAIGNGKGAGGLYIPVGALWGAADLQAMANRNALHSVTITMKKHPAMLHLCDARLNETLAALIEEEASGKVPTEETLLFEGSVRDVCPIAPNNVNTMACCAMASHTLGFDGTVGRLVADARLTTHEIEIVALGKPAPSGQQFRLHLSRSSPAPKGQVTSKATYGSFLESILKVHCLQPGVFFV
jgi:aspartate dehydrogenase